MSGLECGHGIVLSWAYLGTLLDAIKIAGVRALISAGWSGMGGVDIPSSVFVLGAWWASPIQSGGLTKSSHDLQVTSRMTGCSRRAESAQSASMAARAQPLSPFETAFRPSSVSSVARSSHAGG